MAQSGLAPKLSTAETLARAAEYLAFQLPVFLLETVNHPTVSQGSRIADYLAIGDIAQKSPHDFATARLGKFRCDNHFFRPCEGADFRGNMLTDIFPQ